MPFDWRQLSAQQMNEHFNPRVACPDAQDHLDRFIARSADAQQSIPGLFDLRYGDGEKQTLDVHIPEQRLATGPLVIFIHGGYWRGLDKCEHSFVAPTIMHTGAVVANVNYDLCPNVTLDAIVEEISQAITYCHLNARQWGADPNNLYLVGHSAGAHLAVQMLLRSWPQQLLAKGAIRAVAAITGVYEPEVILQIPTNDDAKISAETAARQTCLGREFTLRPSVLVAVGGNEPPGWIDQSQRYAEHCRTSDLPTESMIVPATNHFTILEHAVNPETPLCKAMFKLWQ